MMQTGPQHMLFNAAIDQPLGAIKKCIAEGADINYIDYDKGSFLHQMARNRKFNIDNIDAIEYLLSKGADINLTDKDLQTPIEVALESEHYKILFYLLEKRNFFSEIILNRLMKFCYTQCFKQDPMEESLLLDYVASRLTGTDIFTLRREKSRAKCHIYFNHINISGKDLKIGENTAKLLDAMSLEGIKAGEFLALRIRSWLEILLHVEQNTLQLQTDLQQTDIIKRLRREICCELETLRLFHDIDVLREIPEQQQDACFEAIQRGMLFRLKRLQEGMEYTCHSGWDSHAIYVNFTRSRENIIIRIDNLMQMDLHCKTLTLHPRDPNKVGQMQPRVLGQLSLQELEKNQPYLADILNAKRYSGTYADSLYATRLIYNCMFPPALPSLSLVSLAFNFDAEQTIGNCVAANHNVGLRARLKHDVLYHQLCEQEQVVAMRFLQSPDYENNLLAEYERRSPGMALKKLQKEKSAEYWEAEIEQNAIFKPLLIQQLQKNYQSFISLLLDRSKQFPIAGTHYTPLVVLPYGTTDPPKSVEFKRWFKEIAANKSRVLLYGRRGMGKSTFCRYVAYQIQAGKQAEWQNEFDFVFWISLKNLNSDYYKADKVYRLVDIVQRECCNNQFFPDYVLSAWQTLLDSPATKILWLLDGHDELHNEPDSSPQQFAIVLQELLNKPCCVMTSQLRDVNWAADAEYEITGFENEDIKSYVRKIFTAYHLTEEHADKLSLQLLDASQMNMLQVSMNPLLLELICSSHDIQQLVITSTRSVVPLVLPPVTQLYDKLINNMLDNHFQLPLNQSSAYANVEHFEFIKKEYYAALQALAYIAYTAQPERRNYLFTHEVQECLQQLGKNNRQQQLLINGLIKTGLVYRISSREIVRIEFFNVNFMQFLAVRFATKLEKRPALNIQN